MKKAAVQRYAADESIPAICEDLQVALSTLYRWIKLYRNIELGHHSYSPLEFDAISRRLIKAEHQLEIIRLTEIISKNATTNAALFLDPN
ncbi:MAG: helix-turn-helix domain-containing protein [Clostridiales bacterium]|nr:helix-turn-helix domain-containing protein [Clostridiales bacterium]